MPTLAMDEGDIKESDESQEIMKLFNLGFEDGNRMFNCDKNDPSKIEFFNPYCPKVITRRRQFTDQATESRTLTETMKQTSRKDIPPLLTKRFHEKQMEIRNKLLKFRFDYYNKIDIDSASQIDMGDIEPRIKQATLAFTTLLSNSPEALQSFKEFVQGYNKQVIEDRAGSFDGQIVNIIIEILLKGNQQISSADIEVILKDKGFKTTAATIGRHLAQLKISTKLKKVEGSNKRLIIFDEQFLGVVKRYCSDSEKVSEVSRVSGVSEDPYQNAETTQTILKKPINKNQRCTDTADTSDTADTKMTSKSQLLAYFQGRGDRPIHEDELKPLVQNEDDLYNWIKELAKEGQICYHEPEVWRYMK